ncbi:MAG TPA: hypothetical protein VJB96_05270 [Patescibacteria group bacterium]|nr:hypothetical protein [Patescibacteria group bacterium]
MPLVLAVLPKKKLKIGIGRRVEINPPQNLDGEPDAIFVMRFRRSEHPLDDGFFHGAFTRITLGESLKIHPNDLIHVNPKCLNVLENKRQWVEMWPQRPVRVVQTGDQARKPVAFILT